MPVPDLNTTLDGGVLTALLDFEDRDSPGLFEDLCEGFTETARLLRVDLNTLAGSGLDSEEMRKRSQRFRDRCMDLGAGRMVLQLDRLLTLAHQEQLVTHAAVAAAARAALSAAGIRRAGFPRAAREARPARHQSCRPARAAAVRDSRAEGRAA